MYTNTFCVVDSKCIILAGNSSDSISISNKEIKDRCEQLLNAIKSYKYLNDINIGIGSSFSNINNITESYINSINAIKLHYVESNSSNLCNYNTINGLYQSLLHNNRNTCQQIYQNILQPLITYDKNNNTNYVAISEAYINNDCKIASTAEILYLHRNTLSAPPFDIDDKFRILQMGKYIYWRSDGGSHDRQAGSSRASVCV